MRTSEVSHYRYQYTKNNPYTNKQSLQTTSFFPFLLPSALFTHGYMYMERNSIIIFYRKRKKAFKRLKDYFIERNHCNTKSVLSYAHHWSCINTFTAILLWISPLRDTWTSWHRSWVKSLGLFSNRFCFQLYVHFLSYLIHRFITCTHKRYIAREQNSES